MSNYRIWNICNECPFFRDKSTWGICGLTNKTHYRDDSCITYVNDTKQAIKVLHSFQKYRRGANIKMPPPVIIGEAIDYAIHELRKQNK
jgi:hypothetical protein